MTDLTDFLTRMKPAIDAAADGRLRCAHCGLQLTMVDPETDRVMKVRDFGSTIVDGEPLAWCRPCC